MTLSPMSGLKNPATMMPKAKGDPYFVSCRIGAEEAARELGVETIDEEAWLQRAGG